MSERRTFVRATTIVAAITALSRVLGLVRDMVAGALLGAGRVSDVFWIAFELPNLARRALGEGALSAFIVPLFTAEERERGEAAAWRFAANALNAVLILGLILTVLGLVFSRELFMVFGGLGLALREGTQPQALELGARLTRIMFPYLLLLGMASVLMGLCHARRRFAAPAFGSVVLNLAMIGSGVAFWLLHRGRLSGADDPQALVHQARFALWLSLAVMGGIFLRVVIHLPTLWREGFRFRPILDRRDRRLRQLFAKMPFALVGLLMAHLMISVNKFFAMFMDDGYVTQLSYSSRIIQLPLGIVASAMATTILPQLAQHLHEERSERLHALFGFAMRAVLILFVPAMVGLILLRQDLIALLFERLNWTASDTRGAAWALLFYALGLVPMAALSLIVPLYYARLNLRQPVQAAAAALGLNIALNAVFMLTPLRQGGLALATSLSVTANLMMLLAWQEGGIGRVAHWGLGATAARCALSAAVMAGALIALRAGFVAWGVPLETTAPRAAFIAIAVPAGAAVYFAIAAALKTPDLAEALRLIRSRRGK